MPAGLLADLQRRALDLSNEVREEVIASARHLVDVMAPGSRVEVAVSVEVTPDEANDDGRVETASVRVDVHLGDDTWLVYTSHRPLP